MAENNLTKKINNSSQYSFKTTDKIQKADTININYIYKLLYKYEKNYKYIDNSIYSSETDFKDLFPNNTKLHKFLFDVSQIRMGDYRRTLHTIKKVDTPKILNFD